MHALCCSHTVLAAFAFDEAKVNVEPLSFVCSLPGRVCVMLFVLALSAAGAQDESEIVSATTE